VPITPNWRFSRYPQQTGTSVEVGMNQIVLLDGVSDLLKEKPLCICDAPYLRPDPFSFFALANIRPVGVSWLLRFLHPFVFPQTPRLLLTLFPFMGRQGPEFLSQVHVPLLKRAVLQLYIRSSPSRPAPYHAVFSSSSSPLSSHVCLEHRLRFASLRGHPPLSLLVPFL